MKQMVKILAHKIANKTAQNIAADSFNIYVILWNILLIIIAYFLHRVIVKETSKMLKNILLYRQPYGTYQRVEKYFLSAHYRTSIIGLIIVLLFTGLGCTIIPFWYATLVTVLIAIVLNTFYSMVNKSFFEDCLEIFGFCLLMICGLLSKKIKIDFGKVR
nr:hypothetical protein [uncultured Flavobacterium sp.]